MNCYFYSYNRTVFFQDSYIAHCYIHKKIMNYIISVDFVQNDHNSFMIPRVQQECLYVFPSYSLIAHFVAIVTNNLLIL